MFFCLLWVCRIFLWRGKRCRCCCCCQRDAVNHAFIEPLWYMHTRADSSTVIRRGLLMNCRAIALGNLCWDSGNMRVCQERRQARYTVVISDTVHTEHRVPVRSILRVPQGLPLQRAQTLVISIFGLQLFLLYKNTYAKRLTSIENEIILACTGLKQVGQVKDCCNFYITISNYYCSSIKNKQINLPKKGSTGEKKKRLRFIF